MRRSINHIFICNIFVCTCKFIYNEAILIFMDKRMYTEVNMHAFGVC